MIPLLLSHTYLDKTPLTFLSSRYPNNQLHIHHKTDNPTQNSNRMPPGRLELSNNPRIQIGVSYLVIQEELEHQHTSSIYYKTRRRRSSPLRTERQKSRRPSGNHITTSDASPSLMEERANRVSSKNNGKDSGSMDIIPLEPAKMISNTTKSRLQSIRGSKVHSKKKYVRDGIRRSFGNPCQPYDALPRETKGLGL